jgi:hypothetical protein
VVVPCTEADALTALANVEQDSDANRPADLHRPTLGSTRYRDRCAAGR